MSEEHTIAKASQLLKSVKGICMAGTAADFHTQKALTDLKN